MTTTQILNILNIAAWILFIGLCIRTGAMLISFTLSLLANPEASGDLYLGLNLYELFEFSKLHYVVMAGLIIIITGLKAFLFYRVVKIISGIKLTHPFSEDIVRHISKMSGTALQIGIIALFTAIYAKWLMKHQIHFTFEGDDTGFLFLAGILFVIAMIFKRGTELQSENELTV